MVEPNEPLSERELEILRLVSTGAANKEIAHQLGISPNTVKVHLRNIFTKIGVASRTEAMLYAMQTGLVKADLSQEIPLEAASEIVKDAPGAAQAGSTTVLPPSKSRHFPGLRNWQMALVILSALTLISISAFFSMRMLQNPTAAQATQVIVQAAAQDLAQQRWTEKSSLATARKGMGFVEYESALYLIAGETVDGVNGTVLRYTEAENEWKELAQKPTPVTDIQAVVLGEKIYVPGGRMSNGQTTDRLEVYNPRENTWENKAPLPTALSAYALAAFEGDLYLFGGKNGSKYLDIVFYYNTKEDRWEQRASMSAPRAYFAAVPDGGKI